MIYVAEVGDTVVYKGEKYEVVKVSTRERPLSHISQDFTASSSSGFKLELLGSLSYQLDNGLWITAFEASPYPDKGQVPQIMPWLEDLEPLPDNSTLLPAMMLLGSVQYDKEKFYGSSWKGKGEYRGIMSNIDRKYDRLDNMTQQELEGKIPTLKELEEKLASGEIDEDQIGESKIDAIADFTNYGLLYFAYVRVTYPNLFKVWVSKNVPKYLQHRIPFI
ncbi:hypothetical protein D3C74_54300 [compost metagenome]